MDANHNPCHMCQKRVFGCHSVCPDYLEWHKFREELRVANEKKSIDAANQYEIFAKRLKRRSKRRGNK